MNTKKTVAAAGERNKNKNMLLAEEELLLLNLLNLWNCKKRKELKREEEEEEGSHRRHPELPRRHRRTRFERVTVAGVGVARTRMGLC